MGQLVSLQSGISVSSGETSVCQCERFNVIGQLTKLAIDMCGKKIYTLRWFTEGFGKTLRIV